MGVCKTTQSMTVGHCCLPHHGPVDPCTLSSLSHTLPLYTYLGQIVRWSFGTKKKRSAAPLLSDTASRAHIAQAALVLQHQLFIANYILIAEDTADAAAVGGESGELARVALLFGTVGSRE